MKRQLGILCPGLLTLMISVSVDAQQIVEYSMYDEFGDIMFESLEHLVQNRKFGEFDLESSQNDVEIDQFRYRSKQDSLELTLPGKKKYNSLEYLTNRNKARSSRPEWKFRPLDEKKDKKIVIIEEKPVENLLQQPQQSQQSGQLGQQLQQGFYGSGYGTGYGTGYGYGMGYMPMMPISPMMPMYPMVPGFNGYSSPYWQPRF